MRLGHHRLLHRGGYRSDRCVWCAQERELEELAKRAALSRPTPGPLTRAPPVDYLGSPSKGLDVRKPSGNYLRLRLALLHELPKDSEDEA